MEGVRLAMPEDCLSVGEYLEFFERLFRKLLEDALEAYHRTPMHISSRPYVERILRLTQAGLTAAMEARRCHTL